jgi:GTP pyrophosphokinase
MNIDNVIDTYKLQQNDFREYAKKVNELLEYILEEPRYSIHSITFREKDPKSLREKINREGKSYSDPLAEITDLAAVRVIAHFPSRIDYIFGAIRKHFVVDYENSIDKRKTTNPSYFGYASLHLVIELTDERLALPEYSKFKGKKCEIQVRTILQHAWADIDHDLEYKNTESIPFELRRRFASLAGLLELADKEFESIYVDTKNLRKKIKEDINNENINLPINLDTLKYYFEIFHNELKYMPKLLNNLVLLLNKCKIKTVEEFHTVITSDCMDRVKASLEATEADCAIKQTNICLLPYMLTVGDYFKIPFNDLDKFIDCSVMYSFYRNKTRIGKGAGGAS